MVLNQDITITNYPTSLFPDAWEIGRVVLNEAGLCWQPARNFGRGYRIGRQDPSLITTNQQQARRVVEKAQNRVFDLTWNERENPLTRTDHEILLDTIFARQGARRPVFCILDPHNVNTGTGNDPAASDTLPKTLYGHFDDEMDVDWLVNDLGSTRIKMIEQVG